MKHGYCHSSRLPIPLEPDPVAVPPFCVAPAPLPWFCGCRHCTVRSSGMSHDSKLTWGRPLCTAQAHDPTVAWLNDHLILMSCVLLGVLTNKAAGVLNVTISIHPCNANMLQIMPGCTSPQCSSDVAPLPISVQPWITARAGDQSSHRKLPRSLPLSA